MAVRTRTTLGAVVVVALALLIGAAALVLVVRGSLHDAAEATAEHRAADLAAQVEAGGPPASPGAADPEDDDEDPEDPEEVVWQVLGPGGAVVSASQPLTGALPADDEDVVDLAGADHPYVVASEEAEHAGTAYVVVVGVSLEDVDETTAALLTPLLVGLPVLLLVVGATTWLVVSRALGPVERIRREVEQITGSRLDRRVPEPPARDEIGRLARTMNGMLGRLQDSARRQEEFVGDASHELRSPLASLRQAAEVAQAHPGALDEGELAATVLEESVRMQVLVDQLLVLTRAGEGRGQATRVDVDVDDLVLTEARRAARSGIAADTTAVGPGRVQGDPVALGQVVRNLVDNALRHARTRIALGVVEDGAGVRVSVEDDGPGIPEADRERVFERFVRLDDARARDAGGSGLGLAIVRELVRAHGGTVSAEGSALGGARFVVRLPS
ncbi:cell wall metabolism sensor histidine kinase WalK [Pimelobacter sp. 30-1]|uniref:sensor histidine kinase n=1 Tax=Pimelobacter sp. 30-1 TaxID=2004991 RepID=UPI001C051759|nr:ATP-binding protein [Pimelobacter sp. 30-1]